MAGLYDGIDPQTALLLGLGSGLLGTQGQGRRASFGEALANGMQAGTAGYRQAIGDRQRAEQMALEQQAREQQMMLAREQMQLARANAERDARLFPGQLRTQTLGNERTQAELDALRRTQAQAEAMMTFRRNLAQPPQPITPIQAGSQGPFERNVSAIGQTPPQADLAARLRQGVMTGQISPADAKAILETGDYGRVEVARTADTTGPGGVPMMQQLDKFGDPVGRAMPKPFELKMTDTGSRIVGTNPYTGLPMGGTLNKEQTPDGRASSAVAWANNSLARQRLEHDKRSEGGMVYNADAGGFIPKVLRAGDQPMVVPLAGGAGGKPPTEYQSKAVYYGGRLVEADALARSLEDKGVTRGSLVKRGAESVPLIGGGLGMAANATFASKDQQSYAQAQENFAMALLRPESGAVLAPDEVRRTIDLYFPVPGDGPAQIRQKQESRAIAIQGIRYGAGPHASQIDQTVEGMRAQRMGPPVNARQGQAATQTQTPMQTPGLGDGWSNFGVAR